LGYTFGFAWTYANTKDTAPDGQTTAYMNAFGKNVGATASRCPSPRLFDLSIGTFRKTPAPHSSTSLKGRMAAFFGTSWESETR